MTDFGRGFDAGFRAGLDQGLDVERTATSAAERSDGDREKPLDLAAVKAMTADEINARWDEVLPLLEEAGRVR